MKKRAIFAMFVGGFFFATACSSDDDSSANNNQNENVEGIANNMTSGAWRVTSYIDSGNVETNDFAGYNFTFSTNNVLTASNGTNSYTGVWTVSNDDSNDDNPSNDIDFDIFFSAPALFAELSDDWDVLESTATTIRLVDNSGGNGDTDYLTFEKNL